MNYTWYNRSWSWSPWSFHGLGLIGALIALLVVIIVVVIKGYALWHAARRSENVWFIILLIVNTIGILDLIYLYFVVGKWHKFSESKKPTATPPSTTPTV